MAARRSTRQRVARTTVEPLSYPPVPSSGMNWLKILVPVLGVLLLGTSFLVGVLWTKLSYVQSGAAASCTTSPLSSDCLKNYAKELKLDKKKFAQCLDSGSKKEMVNADVSQGSSVGVTGTPATFVNGYLISGAQPYDNFKRIIDFLLAGGDLAKPDETVRDLVTPATGETQALVSNKKASVDLGGAPVRGSASSAVTVVEFSDFECPFCGRMFTQTLPQLQRDYIDTGKVRFVYKQFPLTSIHKNAQWAAEASLCALEQGKFWEMHDKLFTAMNAKTQ